MFCQYFWKNFIDIITILCYKTYINHYNLYIYIMKVKNTLRFFREFYHIPQRIKLKWCILQETHRSTTVLRLGVVLIGTDKAIDVAARNFVQIDNSSEVNYKVLPARRVNCKNWFMYISNGETRLCTPKTYVHDIYFRSVYSPELQNSILL